MFARLVGESFVRNPRRKILTAAALVVGMAVATATLTVALDVGDRLAREFRERHVYDLRFAQPERIRELIAVARDTP